MESDYDVVLTFELPGMDKKNIKVWIEDSVLTVSGERKIRDEKKSDGSADRNGPLSKQIFPSKRS